MLPFDMVFIIAVGTLRQWTNLIQVVEGKKIHETEKSRDVWPCLVLWVGPGPSFSTSQFILLSQSL